MSLLNAVKSNLNHKMIYLYFTLNREDLISCFVALCSLSS